MQLEACNRYCDDQGLVVVSEFRDVESGLNPDRREYIQAVELARSRGIDRLVVWRLDRSQSLKTKNLATDTFCSLVTGTPLKH